MDVITYLVVGLFVVGVSYSLMLHIQHLLTIKKSEKASANRRLMIGNYITCFSIACFLVTFILNVLVYLQFIHSHIVTSNNTSIICLLFLFVIFISKFVITSKDYTRFKESHNSI